jgi:DNA polymerase-3 subunit alpha
MERAKSKLKFVGLHAHSVAGSPFDALGYPSDHMDFAYENGMDAMALTDHGNMNGFSWQLLHAKKMNKEGRKFKPLFGCEAYYIKDVEEWQEAFDAANEKKKKEKAKGVNMEASEGKNRVRTYNHLLLIAQNQKGLNNLFKLVSTSHEDKYFYRKPRIDLKLLKEYNEGLICSTTCISGPFAQVVWDNPEASHEELVALMRPVVEDFIDIFGKERYFGELQWNNIPEQHKLNKCIVELSKEYGIKMISTVDSRLECRRNRTGCLTSFHSLLTRLAMSCTQRTEIKSLNLI